MEDKKGCSETDSSCLFRSHSVPSLSQTTSPENKSITRSQSLPDLLLKSCFEEFTPDITVHTDPTDSDHQTSEVSISVPPPSSQNFSTSASRKRKSKGRCEKKDSFTSASVIDYPAGVSGHMQDDTREMEPHSTAGPSNLQLSSSDDEDSDSAELYGKRARIDRRRGYDEDTTSVFGPASCGVEGYFPSAPFSPAQSQALLIPTRKDTDDGGPSFDSSRSAFGTPTCSQFTAPTVPQHPQRRKTVLVLKESTVCTEGSKAFEVSSVQSENDSGGDSYTLRISTQPPLSHLPILIKDPGWSERDSSRLSRSHSVPSLSQTTSPENKTFTRSQSLPDMLLKSSSEEFTPDITVHTDPTDSDHQTSEVSISVPPPSPQTSASRKRKFEDHCRRSGKKHKKDSFTAASDIDYPADVSGHMQDDTREMEPHSTAGPSNLQLFSGDDEDSDSAEVCGQRARIVWLSGYDEDTTSVSTTASGVDEMLMSRYDEEPATGSSVFFAPTSSTAQWQTLGSFEEFTHDITSHTLELSPVIGLPALEDFQTAGLYCDLSESDDNVAWMSGPSTDIFSSAFGGGPCSQSTAPTVCGPPCPQDRPVVPQYSTVCTEGSRAQDDDVLMETETSDTALDLSVTNNQSTHSRETFARLQISPDILTSFKEFTPDIAVHTDPIHSDSFNYFSVPPPSSQSFSTSACRKRKLKGRCEKKDSFTSASVFDYPASTSGHMQDDTREMEPHSTAGPSNLQLSSSDDKDSDSAELYRERSRISLMRLVSFRHAGGYFATTSSQAQGQAIHLPDKKNTDDRGPSLCSSSPTLNWPSCSQSTAQNFWGPPCPQDSPVVPQGSTVCTEGSRAQDDDVLMAMETSDTALDLSVTNNQSTHSHLQLSSSDPGWSERDSGRLPCSHSVPSLSQTTESCSFEEFTPDIIDDEDDETYWFQCSCPGLYQCSVTGLVFHMEGEGDVVYRTVPWDRRLLAQHHKQPAGPLFDIKCLQQSVCQLHLPHCESRSTGGCEFLSVAHVNDEGIEFIVPQKITETHVIINITGFSAFGNVKDEDSPPDPVRALVLLFYRPPVDPDPESLLNVLLLPVNIVLRDVLRTRKKLVGDEIYIETSPKCKLSPKQEYTLSTCPEDDSVLVQPTEAEFDCDNYDNYFPSFQVILEKLMKHIKLFLRETKSSKSVWERRVCLSSTAVKRSCGPSALNLPPNDRLLDIRSSFIDGISGPVLRSLLDKLLEKTVLTDSERESADEIQNHRDKARFVVDTVRKKGEAASSEMIEFLCEVDPFLCEHLGLI